MEQAQFEDLVTGVLWDEPEGLSARAIIGKIKDMAPNRGPYHQSQLTSYLRGMVASSELKLVHGRYALDKSDKLHTVAPVETESVVVRPVEKIEPLKVKSMKEHADHSLMIDHMAKLEKRLTCPCPLIKINDKEIKIDVLNRLAAILDPSIGHHLRELARMLDGVSIKA